MHMKMRSIKTLLAISAIVCIIAGFSAIDGYIEEWIAAAIVVVFFPVFVVSLGLWWKASDKEGDYPFVGY